MTVLYLFNTDPACKTMSVCSLRQKLLSNNFRRSSIFSNCLLLVFAPQYSHINNAAKTPFFQIMQVYTLIKYSSPAKYY